MKKKLVNVLLILFFLTGLSLVLYPTVSDLWNSMHQSMAISTYSKKVTNLNQEDYDKMWNDAVNYNEILRDKENRWFMSDMDLELYNSLLDVSGNGVMGYVEIPKINCMLPIYHGTDEAVLQVAIGHITGTSLPVGGRGTHTVLSGHRGLPSAVLFTNIDQLVEGDRFSLHVLDEVLTYEVDQIVVVEPNDVRDLSIEDNQDYCTLMTCTPYGVNTHRLLVRGHRIDSQVQEEGALTRVTTDAVKVELIQVVPVLAVILFIIIMSVVSAFTMMKGKRKSEK